MPTSSRGLTACLRNGLAISFGIALMAVPPVHTTPPSEDWSAPVNLGGAVNSPFHEFLPTLSRDGLSLYFASDRPGSLGGEDLWVSRRASAADPWGAAVNLGDQINTSANERSPELSKDGHFLFFASTRPGGFGAFDIWVSWRARKHEDSGWTEPVNLGPGVNTAFGDFGPSYLQDDGGVATLFFSSNRPGGLGNADIYSSDQSADGSFGPATAIVELNTPLGDFRPSVRGDGLELILDSNRPAPPELAGVGLRDLWRSTRASRSASWSAPENLGPPVNSAFNDLLAMLSADGRTLVFGSNRPGGFGGDDLYVSTRERRPAADQ